jgi:predicted protein tyrosine phosphatase
MNLLFVCSENKLRSATGEEVFSGYDGVDAIGCGTNSDAVTTMSGDLIEWADIVFVMENRHRTKVTKKFNALLKNKRLICLDIPDEYYRMEPSLIKLLKSRVLRHIHNSVRKKG